MPIFSLINSSFPETCPTNTLVFDIYKNSISPVNLIYSQLPYSSINGAFGFDENIDTYIFSGDCPYCAPFSVSVYIEFNVVFTGNSTQNICTTPFNISIYKLNDGNPNNIEIGDILYTDNLLTNPLINVAYLVDVAGSIINPRKFYSLNILTGEVVSSGTTGC
jgi:hypothetical protein